VDVQKFGDHCIIDHNSYAVIGRPFEGKIRTLTFSSLPSTEFEKHGRQLPLKTPFPSDPAAAYEPPDLSQLTAAGAYLNEPKPIYGPRP
jgi:hypothetical protein